jgi:TetR/AcrR family transcriptional repressor of nem operon
MPRKSDARDRLMNAAMDLIWKHSYGSSVRAPSARRQMREGQLLPASQSSLGWPSRRPEADWQRKKARMDEIFSASVPPLGRLRDYFKHVYEGQTKRHGECGSVLGCPYCTLGCEIGTQDRAIGDQVHKILDRNARYFESAIRDAHAQGLISAPDAKAKARMLVAFFQGCLAQARIENDIKPLRGLAASALELLGARPELSAK